MVHNPFCMFDIQVFSCFLKMDLKITAAVGSLTWKYSVCCKDINHAWTLLVPPSFSLVCVVANPSERIPPPVKSNDWMSVWLFCRLKPVSSVTQLHYASVLWGPTFSVNFQKKDFHPMNEWIPASIPLCD